MSQWTLKYRCSINSDFQEMQTAGEPDAPPDFGGISPSIFAGLEVLAARSDERGVIFYKPFNSVEWQRLGLGEHRHD